MDPNRRALPFLSLDLAKHPGAYGTVGNLLRAMAWVAFVAFAFTAVLCVVFALVLFGVLDDAAWPRLGGIGSQTAPDALALLIIMGIAGLFSWWSNRVYSGWALCSPGAPLQAQVYAIVVLALAGLRFLARGKTAATLADVAVVGAIVVTILILVMVAKPEARAPFASAPTA